LADAERSGGIRTARLKKANTPLGAMSIFMVRNGIAGYKLTFGNNLLTLVGNVLGGGTPAPTAAASS